MIRNYEDSIVECCAWVFPLAVTTARRKLKKSSSRDAAEMRHRRRRTCFKASLAGVWRGSIVGLRYWQSQVFRLFYRAEQILKHVRLFGRVVNREEPW